MVAPSGLSFILPLLLALASSEEQGSSFPKCYPDTEPSSPCFFSYFGTTSNSNSASWCLNYCKPRMHYSFYYGLYNGNSCYCAYGLRSSATAVDLKTFCTTSCPGGSGTCGGDEYMQVYYYSGYGLVSDPSTGSTAVGVDNSMNPGVIAAIAVGTVVLVVLAVVIGVVVVKKSKGEDESDFKELM
eukprot:TRINITY_DN4085_c0_g1_i1.p1 TRINITY_DN4085_c0_g1~~TRINITY_DN4085_c0_g1_i1.p1  ORF type:complete len:211 (-),score=21.43 TRINITY_DN4085_c0_g1_i1:158-712(-)